MDNPDRPPENAPRVAMLGSFPPQAQGIQDYGREIAEGIGAHAPIHAIGFRQMYPARLFPGVKTAMDPAKQPPQARWLTCEHPLTWRNPPGWLLRAATVKADIMHLQWWSLPLWPVLCTFALVAKARGLPLVITVHNVISHDPSRFYPVATRLLTRLADRVVVHSPTLAAQAREQFGLPPERIVVIPMPVTHANVVPEKKAVARRSLRLHPDAPVILFFGTIRPYKGLETLLRAFAKLLGRVHNAQLLIAGKPWEPWQKYEDLLNELGIANAVFTFIDYVPEDEVNTLLSAADCFVLPYTHFDAQSAVGALFLPYGRPIVVSDVGGLPDWVKHDPRFIVPPEDPAALAERLAAVLNDLRDTTEWFEVWAQEAAATMSPSAVGAAHIALYAELLGK